MRVRTNIWAIALAVVVLQLTAASAQSPDVRRDLASALRVIRPLVRDDPERAIKMLEAMNEEYPSNSQLLVLLGEAHRIAGNTEAAMAAYLTHRDPDDEPAIRSRCGESVPGCKLERSPVHVHETRGPQR